MFGNLARVVLACRLAGDADPLLLRQLEVLDLRLAGLVFAGEIHGAQVGQVGGEGEGGQGSPDLLHAHLLLTVCLHHPHRHRGHHRARLASPPATQLLTAGQTWASSARPTRAVLASQSVERRGEGPDTRIQYLIFDI